jgi:hypothetical protein
MKATLDGEPCVLKAYKMTDPDERKRVEKEVIRLHELRHQHVVRVQAVFFDASKAYIQMPYYGGGDLKQWLLKGDPNPRTRQRLLSGLLQAVQCMHIAGVTHNDLKLSNVLLTEGAQRAVLSDFELSRADGGATTTVDGGTRAYMAPERQRGSKPTRASDMYSLGVLLLLAFYPEMIEPVENRRTVTGALDSVAARMDINFPGLLSVLRRLTSDGAADRYTIELLLEQQIFTDILVAVPPYWSSMTGDRGLKAVRLRAGADGATLAALREAIITVDPAQLGVGADWNQMRQEGIEWPDIPPTDRFLELEAAWRVQNATLYSSYAGAVDRVYSDVERGATFAPLPPVQIRTELVSAVESLPGLKSAGINEQFLVTGLPAARVHTVLANGMNERFSGANAGCVFGEGSYFAEDAGKCDHYTGAPDTAFKEDANLESLHDLLYEGPDEHPGDVCYLLVCRVVLGYALRTQHPKNHGAQGRGTAMDADATDDGTIFATTRCKELKPLAGSEPPLHHHSLLVELGGWILRYREFVVFHGEYIYPEYLVAYRRGRRPE